jgi:hypothetical protein
MLQHAFIKARGLLATSFPKLTLHINWLASPCKTSHVCVCTHFKGDTRPCPALTRAGANATLLIHEATFEPDLAHQVCICLCVLAWMCVSMSECVCVSVPCVCVLYVIVHPWTSWWSYMRVIITFSVHRALCSLHHWLAVLTLLCRRYPNGTAQALKRYKLLKACRCVSMIDFHLGHTCCTVYSCFGSALHMIF